MKVITRSGDLADVCRRFAAVPYVTVDTEFIRDTTYWPQLCLVQIAGPDCDVAIDTLAEDLDLAPLLDLMYDPLVLKVFHSARQDIEIFYYLGGRVPAPLFDTQLAAMVCGFGEAVGYGTLVKELLGEKLDKSSRFTDWARRPLTDRQLRYALDDVIHLRGVYERLTARLDKSGRSHWLGEEMALLSDPATYDASPEDAWRRIKTRSTNSRFLAILREAAAWRERAAQERDIPRNRIVREEALLEIAAHPPAGPEDLRRVRALPRSMADNALGKALLEAVARGKALPDSELPTVKRPPTLPRGAGPLVDLLKVLLKMKCEQYDVAQKLVATTANLERIAVDDEADVPVLKGWRYEVFGRDALKLKHGRLALAAERSRIELVDLPAPAAAAD